MTSCENDSCEKQENKIFTISVTSNEDKQKTNDYPRVIIRKSSEMNRI